MQAGDAGGIVISSKAVSGEFAVGLADPLAPRFPVRVHPC